MVRKARDLTLEKGILAIPGSQIVNKISQEVMETVKFFYEDDEYSMMMPRAKDRVSVKKNEYNDEYNMVRFSWAGSPGTYAVCVCVIRENVYLLASVLNLHQKEAIHQLMDKIVCSRDNTACMFHCYTDCPNNSESLKNYLSDLLKDYDDEEEIQFSQWINDGRMKLQTMTLPVEEFKELVTEKIVGLIPHSYISKIQSSYLKTRKENLKDDECLILMSLQKITILYYKMRYNHTIGVI
ncbi:hypothetical protein AVEN_117220-1 [Araneus ventricosus]|uniref:Uncharacterized protein n=1 Tax=Araneus ventricosus TaxID=182803 RepID=A0A4Y2AXK9_ARAVE|nr:hypothetical protein AVEN_117220-1 [Araneus ventricosus]